jgi:hypothetical protein
MATAREQMSAFRARHRERLKLQARQYRNNHAAEISIRRKAVYAARREDILAALRIKRAKHPEAQRNTDRAYRARLRNDLIRAKIAREKDRLKVKRLRDTNTLYRLTNALRSRLTKAVRVQPRPESIQNNGLGWVFGRSFTRLAGIKIHRWHVLGKLREMTHRSYHSMRGV